MANVADEFALEVTAVVGRLNTAMASLAREGVSREAAAVGLANFVSHALEGMQTTPDEFVAKLKEAEVARAEARQQLSGPG